MLLTTGHQVLDESAVVAVRRWRAKSAAPRHLDVPINFILPDTQGIRSFVTNDPIRINDPTRYEW